MVLACLIAALFGGCPPPGDLLALPDLPPVPTNLAPAPGVLEARLASSLRRVVPGSVVGPVRVRDLGALAAAVRCQGVDRQGRGTGGCEVVVAHLTTVTDADGRRRLEPSGLAGALPMRSRGARVTRLAAPELDGDGLPSVLVAGEALDRDGAVVAGAGWVGLLDWGGFAAAWGPVAVRAEDAPAGCAPTLVMERACGPRRELVLGCGDAARRWAWRDERRAFVRVREDEAGVRRRGP